MLVPAFVVARSIFLRGMCVTLGDQMSLSIYIYVRRFLSHMVYDPRRTPLPFRPLSLKMSSEANLMNHQNNTHYTSFRESLGPIDQLINRI